MKQKQTQNHHRSFVRFSRIQIQILSIWSTETDSEKKILSNRWWPEFSICASFVFLFVQVGRVCRYHHLIEFFSGFGDIKPHHSLSLGYNLFCFPKKMSIIWWKTKNRKSFFHPANWIVIFFHRKIYLWLLRIQFSGQNWIFKKKFLQIKL